MQDGGLVEVLRSDYSRYDGRCRTGLRSRCVAANNSDVTEFVFPALLARLALRLIYRRVVHVSSDKDSYSLVWITRLLFDSSSVFITVSERRSLQEITRSRGSARDAVRTTSKVNGKCWTLTPQTTHEPLQRSSPNPACVITSWIPSISKKNRGQSVKGFRLPIYAKYTPQCSLRSRVFTTFLVLPIAYSRDAVP